MHAADVVTNQDTIRFRRAVIQIHHPVSEASCPRNSDNDNRAMYNSVLMANLDSLKSIVRLLGITSVVIVGCF